MAVFSFKLARLISGTNAVYSCKRDGFTLMCKDFGGDEEGEWKRCNRGGNPHCFVFFYIFVLFLHLFLGARGRSSALAVMQTQPGFHRLSLNAGNVNQKT